MMRSLFCLLKRRNIPSLFFSLLGNGWTIFALEIFAYGGIWSAVVWVDRSTNSATSIAQPLLWTSSLIWDTFEIKLILRFLSIIHSDSFVAQSLLVSCAHRWHNPFFRPPHSDVNLVEGLVALQLSRRGRGHLSHRPVLFESRTVNVLWHRNKVTAGLVTAGLVTADLVVGV